MKKIQLWFLLTSAFLVVAAPPSRAELSDVSLDNAGRVLRIHTGSYGELFPEGAAAVAETPVVALEVQWADSPSTFLLVPGTETDAAESSARIFWSSGPETATLMWLTGGADETKTLDLRTVRQTEQGIEWSEVYQVQANEGPQRFDTWPEHLVTSDEHRLAVDGDESIITRRTLVHLLWRQPEEQTSGIFYTALTFVDGTYTGTNQRVDLGATFLQSPEDPDQGPAPPLTAGLAGTTHIRGGQGPGSISIAFGNPATQRLGTLEVEIMPLQLATLGDLVREEAYASADAYDPGNIQVFADEMKAGIVIIGYHLRLHPAVTDYLATELERWIQDEGSSYGYGSFPDLGNDARELTLQLSRSVYASTISDPFDPDSTTLEIGLGDFLDDLESGGSAQRIGVRETINLAAPVVDEGPTWIFTSTDGSAMLVAWQTEQEPETLRYVESRDGQSWSDPRSIELSDRLSAEQARQLLQNRVP